MPDESYVYRLVTAVEEYLLIARVDECGDPLCKLGAINRAVAQRLRSVLDEAKVNVHFDKVNESLREKLGAARQDDAPL